MPRYVYRAKDAGLNLVQGTIEAESETAAIARLGSEGVFPIVLSEAGAEQQTPTTTSTPARHRVPPRILAYMSRQLADLLTGGLSLFNALSLLAQQTEHKALRGVIADVANSVREGQPFSESLARHPAVFSPLYLNMVRAGEAGGGLDAVLVRLADLLEGESELKSRVASALIYPMVVLCIGLASILFLLVYVVPRLMVLFVETGQLLPLPTRILLAISGALTQGWWLWLLGIAGGAWMLRTFRRSPSGQAMLDRLVLRLPLAGVLSRKLQTARFTRNLGVMVGQGVSMMQALEVANSTMSNVALRQAIDGVSEAVRGGENLANALTATGEFSPFVTNMVAVGEESGTLETALLKVAGSYEREADRALKAFTTMLEPLLIVLVGLVVMFIVISILLPIFQIGLAAQ